MSAARLNGIVPESEWDEHKAAIEQLYLHDRKTLSGPEGVMNTMKSRYGFSATYSIAVQYTTENRADCVKESTIRKPLQEMAFS